MHVLPLDCKTFYNPEFLSSDEATALFAEIVGNYDVKNKAIKMADGTEFVNDVPICYFVDEGLPLLRTFPPVWDWSVWPTSLARVRDRIERATRIRFPLALCIYYEDGSDEMAFHIDPPSHGPTDAIASLSLGAEREFVFRNLSDSADTYSITLGHGSLLYMGEHCQERYEHGLPRSETCDQPRINLTFRRFGYE